MNEILREIRLVKQAQLAVFIIFNTLLFWAFINYHWYYFIPISLLLFIGHIKTYYGKIVLGISILKLLLFLVLGVAALYSVIAKIVDIVTRV